VQDARVTELEGELAGLYEASVALSDERDAVAATRDSLETDNGLLEERNENLVDANVALTADKQQLEVQLQEAAVALAAVPEPTSAPACPEPELCPESEPCPTCELQDARVAELTVETQGLGEVVVTLTAERDTLVAERDALTAERDQLAVDNGLLEERNENLVDSNVASAQDEEIQQAASASLIAGLEAESDRLRVTIADLEAQRAQLDVDIAELELRNGNLVDSNVALTLELSLASEFIPILVMEDVVTEEEIIEEEPVAEITDYDTLYSSVAYGVVADKDLITTLDCEQTEGLYRAIPAQYGVPVEEASSLYTNTDKLNELRLVRQARLQGCPLGS
jgi:hypothetical protein